MRLEDYHADMTKVLTADGLEDIRKRGMVPSRAKILVELIKERENSNILEIGRYKGYTLGLFLFFSPTSTLTSIDLTFQPTDAIGAIINRLAKKRVTLIQGTSDDIPDEKYDLVLIDGDHSYTAAKKDWENVKDKLNPGAVVFFDDVERLGNLWEEVQEETKDITKATHTCTVAGSEQGGAVLRLK